MTAWLLLALTASGEAAAAPLVVAGCEQFPADQLAALLEPRLVGPVVARQDDEETDPAAWRLEVAAVPDAGRVELRDPAGEVWTRDIELAGVTDAGERLRLAAVAAEYLLALAQAPFVPVHLESPLPPPPAGEVATTTTAEPTVVEPTGPEDGSDDGRELPEAGRPPSGEGAGAAEPPLDATTDGWWLGAGPLVGGAGDLSPASPAASGSPVLGLRVELAWRWGMWVHAELAWHFLRTGWPLDASLDLLPVRVGLGAAVPFGEWQFRLGFQAVVEPWWAAGERADSGLRSGAGLLLATCWRPAGWVTVGADLGFELLPEALLVRYYEESLFSAGSWRVRGQLWVAFGGGSRM